MKRDQSLIFTTVPEEDHDHSSIETETSFVGMKNKTRPKFLNLRSKTTDDSTYSNQSTSISNTPAYGPTSVCSTPLTDIKKIVHQGIMSICTNPNKEECNKDVTDGEINESFRTESVNSILSAIDNKSHSSLHSIPCTDKLLKSARYVTVGSSLHDKKKFSSMFELREKLKCLTKRITMKYYNKGPRTLNKAFIADLEESPKKEQKKSFQTITDPTFPVFRNDGKVISKSFYESYIQTHLSLVNSELTSSKNDSSDTDKWKIVEDFDMGFRDFSKKQQQVTTEIEMQPLKKQQPNGSITPVPRKPLTLPLKSLTSDSSESLLSNRRERGVQLTPLMSKLSILNSEERSSGFCSNDTTPSEYRDLYTPSQPNFPFLKKGSTDTVPEVENHNLKKCILFICGQQDMVVNVLLEEAALSAPEVINKLV